MEKQRYTLIDWLRAFAIVLMIAYHFMWDIMEYGFITRSVFESFPIRVVGRTCLLTFLFCVGYSLALSHPKSIDWGSFFIRWRKLAIASLCISLLTYLVYPSKWIYFGILHHISLVSLLLLLFLRVKLLALALGLYLLLPYWLDALGLCQFAPSSLYFWLSNCHYPQVLLWAPTLDFISLVPWSGASLIGVGMSYFNLHEKLLLPRIGVVEYLSRHSFEIYLIHQPVLLAFTFMLSYFLL